MTLRVENVKYPSSPTENYVIVSGRCWGERLFRRTVTANYTLMKGEDIVKDLMDYYAGLSHVRGAVQLVENTDTTYSELEYENSPVWDILKYIAETADDSGVIGFDFRVAPDGKFEFFPKHSKTNTTVIVENIDESAVYEIDIFRIRNKVSVYGLADKSIPTDKVSWTRSLTPSEGDWQRDTGTNSIDAAGAPDGGPCVKVAVASNYWGGAYFELHAGSEVNTNKYPTLDLQLKMADTYSGTGELTIFDSSLRSAAKNISVSPDVTWHTLEVGVGAAYSNQWEFVDPAFDWTRVKTVRVTLYFPSGVGSGNFWIHGLYFGGARYSAVVEDLASQAAWTDGEAREYSETDEELWSDEECERRAASLLAYLKDPAEYVHVVSTILDYGTSPILGGDELHVHLPNEKVDSDFRVESAEYRVPQEDPLTLEITLDLGKEPPQLADFLYGLRCHSPNVEKLSRTKLGKRGVPITSNGSGGNGSSIFYSNVEVDKTAPVYNLLTGRTLKAAFGHDGANTFLVAYLGSIVLRAPTGHILPDDDGSLDLGDTSIGKRFGSLHLKNDLWVAGVQTVDTFGRVALNSFPRDDAGKVLEAQGTNFAPMYVDPNNRYVPAAHTHESLVSSTRHVAIDPDNAVLNFYDDANLKGAIGHDGANFFAVAYDGNLILYSATGKILPNTDGGEDLGTTSSAKRFGSLHLKNDLWVAGVQTIETSGRVNMAGMPRDTAGLIIEAQGAGFYPMYVNPNGRYTPAAHNHASLYPAGGNNTGSCGDTSNYWHVMAGDSVWYNALGHMDYMDDLAVIKRIKMSKKVDAQGVPLIDNKSLPEEMRSKSGLVHGGHLLGLAIGAIKQLNAKVEFLEKQLSNASG